jgi:adenylosuccinate lyase
VDLNLGGVHWLSGLQVLAEPIQTIMRKYSVPQAYEKLKEFTRGQDVSADKLRGFVESLEGVPEDVKADMKEWRPSTYIGIAPDLARNVGDYL